MSTTLQHDPNLRIPIDIIEAVRKIEDWTKRHGWTNWQINGIEVRDYKPQHSEQQKWTIEGEGVQWSVFEKTGQNTRLIVADLTHAQAKWVKDEHNAALTAEHQRLERVIEETHKLHKAELDRLKADYTRELNAKLEQINKQAETINQLTKDYHVKHLNYEKLEQQLLSALAAIGKHNKQVNDDYDNGSTDRQRTIDVDLSLLHEHDATIRDEAEHKWDDWHKFTDEGLAKRDAEVRKPLVYVLTKIRKGCQIPSVYVRMIDDALAKVKSNL